MFEHEAAILRSLDGTVTPRVIDVGEQDGRAYLALSWVVGSDAESVAAELRRLQVAEGQARSLALVDGSWPPTRISTNRAYSTATSTRTTSWSDPTDRSG